MRTGDAKVACRAAFFVDRKKIIKSQNSPKFISWPIDGERDTSEHNVETIQRNTAAETTLRNLMISFVDFGPRQGLQVSNATTMAENGVLLLLLLLAISGLHR